MQPGTWSVITIDFFFIHRFPEFQNSDKFVLFTDFDIKKTGVPQKGTTIIGATHTQKGYFRCEYTISSKDIAGS